LEGPQPFFAKSSPSPLKGRTESRELKRGFASLIKIFPLSFDKERGTEGVR